MAFEFDKELTPPDKGEAPTAPGLESTGNFQFLDRWRLALTRPQHQGLSLLENQIAETIGCAPLRALDDLSRDVWRASASGMIDDDAAQRLAEAIQARRDHAKAGHVSAPKPIGRAWSYFPAKRPQRSPDRQEAMTRRRRLASSGPLPPALACLFTVGELAALHIVADEVRTHGRCFRTLPEIAARAGVCLSTARNALRQAARLGLVTIEERRQYRRPNLANIVRVVSREWLAWLSKGGAFKKVEATDNHISNSRKKGGWKGDQQVIHKLRQSRFGRSRE